MPPDPFERALRHLRRALAQHQHVPWAELDRARRDMEATLDRARRVVEDEQPEFIAMMEEARRRMERDWWDRLTSPRKRPRRRPRKPRGGEPMPVEPRPKPKPLVDGAEAPIE